MHYSPFSLTGKTILITGASSGIGRASAIECSRFGADIVLSGRDEDRLRETLGALGKGQHTILKGDITDEDFIKSLAKQLQEIDGWIHCVGKTMLKPIQVMKADALHDIFDTNTFAPAILLKNLIKEKKIKNGGSIVFISSISGNTNTAVGLSAYGASKAALTALSRYAALELSPRNVRVNTILPGRIETPLLGEAAIGSEATANDILKYPLKRYGKPEEVAYAAIYLLSEASKWVTGTSLVIDGGRSLT